MVGPIAPERNPPINPQYYQPSRFEIANIVTGSQTTITTSEDHNYVLGQLIRVLIPIAYGSTQISGKTGYVTSIPATDEVVVSINSQGCAPFVVSPSYAPNPAQIIAIGDANTGDANPNGGVNNTTWIPGSFINISPL
jgi:hypothetical protein